MKEVWKFYKETKQNRWGHRIYEVSNFGRVKLNGKLFKCTIINGYYYLCHKPLHRIVAELFLPDWDPNKEVDHINTITTDNRACNLRIVNHKENCNNPLTLHHVNISNSRKKGVPRSEEIKQKISESKKGQSNGRLGLHHTEETKQKMRESMKKYWELKHAQT